MLVSLEIILMKKGGSLLQLFIELFIRICKLFFLGLEQGFLLIRFHNNKQMIKLQVNHQKHNPLRTVLIRKEGDGDQNVRKQKKQEIDLSYEERDGSKQKINDKQSRVIGSIQATTIKVKKDLEELINEYKCQAEKMMNNHGHDPQKEMQIKEHLKKLQQQKKERRVKFQKDLAKLQQKKDALQKTDQNSQSLEKRRKSIQERIHKIKEREKRRRENQSQFMKFYQKYKESKPRYKKMQEEFTQKQQKEKQQKIWALKHKIQETYQPMNLQQLSEFETQYLQRKRQAQKLRLRLHLQQRKKQQSNLSKLNDLYKGHCHSNILRELQQRQSKTNQSYEKHKRIRQYSEIVKEEYKPKTRVSNQIEDEEESSYPQSERGKRVVKDRYIHGQYLGKKIQFEKVPLSHSQHINKGIEYLQFLKKLPKKPKISQKQPQTTILTQRKKTISSVYKLQRQYNPLYKGRNYNSIDFTNLQDRDSVNRLMNIMRHKKGELQQKQKLLKNGHYEDRLAFMSAQKEFNNKLVSNIQSKLQILKKL